MCVHGGSCIYIHMFHMYYKCNDGKLVSSSGGTVRWVITEIVATGLSTLLHTDTIRAGLSRALFYTIRESIGRANPYEFSDYGTKVLHSIYWICTTKYNREIKRKRVGRFLLEGQTCSKSRAQTVWEEDKKIYAYKVLKKYCIVKKARTREKLEGERYEEEQEQDRKRRESGQNRTFPSTYIAPILFLLLALYIF